MTLPATSTWWLRARLLRGAILPYNSGGIATTIPNGTAFYPCGGMDVSFGDVRSYPIELGVERVRVNVAPLPLSVDVMCTCSIDAWVGRSKSMVVVFLAYNVAVVSSKDGAIEWSESGFWTMNSISFLISALNVMVGNAIVQLLFWECS